MKRIPELIAAVQAQYPNQKFFANANSRVTPAWRRHYRAYDDALRLLDDESWDILKSKAIQHFMNEREGQQKQAFFNQLNEAFAYRYIQRRGFDRVRFVREGTTRSPDIRFFAGNIESYCEVKTVGISDKEIDRRKGERAYDGGVYQKLSPGLLNKLKSDIDMAWEQIHSVGTSGLVFIMIRFDDVALDYYRGYRRQLIEFCRIHELKNVMFKVGHIGRQRIYIR